MSEQNINFKAILSHPFGKFAIALVAIALSLILLFWGMDKEYKLDSRSQGFNFCFINCTQTGGESGGRTGGEIGSETIIITPLAATLISGGISTIGLGLLIGFGVLEAPIFVALARGATFSLITYGVIQALYQITP